MATFCGAIIVALAGLVQGSGAWPMKLVRKFSLRFNSSDPF
jgi:hypothetical protein